MKHKKNEQDSLEKLLADPDWENKIELFDGGVAISPEKRQHLIEIIKKVHADEKANGQLQTPATTPTC